MINSLYSSFVTHPHIQVVCSYGRRILDTLVETIYEKALYPFMLHPIDCMRARRWCHHGKVVSRPMQGHFYPKAKPKHFSDEAGRTLIRIIKEAQEKNFISKKDFSKKDFYKTCNKSFTKGTCYGQATSVMLSVAKNTSLPCTKYVSSALETHQVFFQACANTYAKLMKCKCKQVVATSEKGFKSLDKKFALQSEKIRLQSEHTEKIYTLIGKKSDCRLKKLASEADRDCLKSYDQTVKNVIKIFNEGNQKIEHIVKQYDLTLPKTEDSDAERRTLRIQEHNEQISLCEKQISQLESEIEQERAQHTAKNKEIDQKLQQIDASDKENEQDNQRLLSDLDTLLSDLMKLEGTLIEQAGGLKQISEHEFLPETISKCPDTVRDSLTSKEGTMCRVSIMYETKKDTIIGHTISLFSKPNLALFDAQVGFIQEPTLDSLCSDFSRYVQKLADTNKKIRSIKLETFQLASRSFH